MVHQQVQQYGDYADFGTSLQANSISCWDLLTGVSGNPKFTMCFWYNLHSNSMVGNTALMSNNYGENGQRLGNLVSQVPALVKTVELYDDRWFRCR